MISTLFPLIRDHYWLKHPKIIDEITFEGRTFLSKYEKIDDYFVIDYNGDEKELFYHKISKILRSHELNDFRAYESKTPSHLHLYVYCGDISAPQREELGKIISNKLEEKLQKQWRIFPNPGLPDAYNILNLPYQIFKG